MLPRPCRGSESAYDKFLLLVHLDLEPFAGPALFIRSIAILRDYSFEAPPFGNAVCRKAILRQTTREQELLRRRSEGGFELLPAARKGFGAKIPTIAIKAIKYREAPHNVTTLQELESLNSLRIECYNLTIENQGSISKLTNRGGNV
jgi:hypothetical protein